MEMLASQVFKQRKSESLLSFTTDGNKLWPNGWNRYLSWNKQRLMTIGNTCGTCGFYFERLPNTRTLNLSIDETRKILEAGLTSLDQGVDLFAPLIPKGKYAAMLFRMSPKSVLSNQVPNYFTTDYEELWYDDIWPDTPPLDYYRAESSAFGYKSKLFEFIIPFQTQQSLDESRVKYYCDILESGSSPTAVCISALDVKESNDWDIEPEFSCHWSFANYILDGHHKVAASARTGIPITMLAFLSLKHSWKPNVEELIAFYKNDT